MRIQNLGPIKDAVIDLNNFNIFIGENGTGKTIAAYAIYSFAYWLKQIYIPHIFSEEDIKNMIQGENYSIEEDKLKDYFYEKIPDAFNEINPKYFEAFFQNQGIFTDESLISVDKYDVKAFLIPNIRKHGWYFSWSYIGGITQTDADASPIDSNVNNNGQLYNEILSSYDSNSKTIETTFLVSGIGTMSQLQLKNRKDQLDSLIKNLGIEKATNFVNQGVKNILFDCDYIYLPAERIGINVFRPYLNLTRLNKGTQNMENSNQNGLENYAQPIESYITFLNNKLKETESASYNDLLFSNSKKIREYTHQLVPGNFEYDLEKDTLHYQLPQSKDKVDFELLSSSLKSIFGLDLFIKHNKIGDWLFCDEPEMNLHPKNQAVVAKLLYEVAKSGYKLLISTHSDYFVKTIINCGLRDMIDKNKFSQKVSVYDFSKNGIQKLNNLFEIDTSISNFDVTTDEINDEYFSLVDELENEEK